MYTTDELKEIAKKVRLGILEEVYSANSGHPGGALSCADILTALYFNLANIDPDNPQKEDRDRIILSKGHASAALYSALAHRGYFDVGELKTFRKLHSNLQGHPSLGKVKGVDMTSGSLGQGLSIANGMALAGKLDNKDYRVYCICGDGEIQEGQIWEAAMSSSHYKLDNLCVIVDNNNLQIDGSVDNVMNPYPIDKKFESFGFNVLVIDGHDIEKIVEALENAKQTKGKPTAIIAKTTKGKGVSYMENQAGWHGKAPKEEEYNLAMEELSK